ncbi:MAG: phosphoglycerate kinase [Candidatus Doudnabacteria bacterium RIFCSPLOWO2_02_FULL_42_9]|uniref:Phosphoglycerate kinase n=1 Tax=Candidatus Doudnabacteria bacterium RIFCSPHIGHO2_01_FULL_41_86 TaxID=1817821 RepID=A0A1F5N957_9BACT|nr:MAG: phosphoglycerate kinase [Candidatus Doudnabacteria bacterium RIFCSPHIGHO2_01_FULL_41_86]OGE75048.1 MAG: phosphoglycerate kinase [Candidatus Doudnabacteria bacterium RIFCSPHIGHO2_01_43_10]OGE85245.1 MAG: phosphoglycerate kinase [Candidatus Doudnabacteria bacterium RIFCSPHIGHO2_12_FULL_42_22]OGE86783.1 MAG: phosphoglycerate kinase [Candidatus Doudnabacteria bacterium RIFCSPHIGHO2_02_FULL_42_25]OGE92382.1 MAG: phosphoglycerate kinase [Candidatus Doudnabacteria bacterium RIFCSPLOWO2_01_FULL
MIKSIKDVKVAGRRVIVRAGFDVPLIKKEEWEVADDTRIKDSLVTLKYLIEQKAKIIIVAHLGRPDNWDNDKSMWPVAQKLGEFLNIKVVKIEDRLPDYKVPHINFLESNIIKNDCSELSKEINGGDILFLENLRFYPGEQKNDTKFVKVLAQYGDIYVEEGFPSAHRKSASHYGLAEKLPAYAGIALLREIKALKKVITKPQQPMIVIMGGAKIDDKVETLTNLAKHATKIILGGAIANTFLKALGYEVGKSKVTDVSIAKKLLRHYKDKIVLPLDVVVATDEESKPRLSKIEKVRPNEAIFDIGPESIRQFAKIIKTGKTLVWNGPFGLFENKRYAFGSKAIAMSFAARSRGAAFGVVGGGETVELVNQAKVGNFVDHLSTGGGAMLEFLAGKELPGIEVLEK